MKNPKPSLKTSSPGARQSPSKLRLSAAALSDFEAIDDYSCEQFSEDVADSYMRGFRELFDLLRRHPRAGSAMPELGKRIRSLTHKRHRIFYIVDEDAILIVRIVHHAMDAKRALRAVAR